MGKLAEIIILGIIQGFTEWLPISSTGHLKIFENFVNLRVPILFDVILHVGTLAVVLVFFRNEVYKILSAVKNLDFKTEYGKMLMLIIIGVIPTLIIGLVAGRLIEAAFQSTIPIAISLIFMGIMLFTTRVYSEKRASIGYLSAIALGIAQGIAIIPGISRSGLTISVALLIGIKREKAFSFSFLLSIPAILGAFILTLFTEFDSLANSGLGWGEILAGLISAMVVGYFILKILWKIISKGRFYLFALYCWTLGFSLIAISILL